MDDVKTITDPYAHAERGLSEEEFQKKAKTAEEAALELLSSAVARGSKSYVLLIGVPGETTHLRIRGAFAGDQHDIAAMADFVISTLDDEWKLQILRQLSEDSVREGWHPVMSALSNTLNAAPREQPSEEPDGNETHNEQLRKEIEAAIAEEETKG